MFPVFNSKIIQEANINQMVDPIISSYSVRKKPFFQLDSDEDYHTIALIVYSFMLNRNELVFSLDRKNIMAQENLIIFKKMVIKYECSPIIIEMQRNENFWNEIKGVYDLMVEKKDWCKEELGECLYNGAIDGLKLIGYIYKYLFA